MDPALAAKMRSRSAAGMGPKRFSQRSFRRFAGARARMPEVSLLMADTREAGELRGY